MPPFLSIRNIHKEFPGVKALNGVSFEIEKGTIHALCGENGAGKSTLMKILSGVYPSDSFSGEIFLNGNQLKLSNVADAEKAGVIIIAQELSLVPEMSIAENIFLGREITKYGIIDQQQTLEKSKEILARLNLTIDPRTPVKQLGIGFQQLVEIARSLSKNASLLILDEPTAALTETESENLLQLLIELKASGVTLIIISHKLKEVLRISDSITVLRDGTSVGSISKAEANEEALIKMMVGRPLNDLFQKKSINAYGEEALSVDNLTLYKQDAASGYLVKNASVSVRKGEIVGIAGLMGAGRTELVSAIFGTYEGATEGGVKVFGKEYKNRTPQRSIKKGICMATEDRKRYGLILPQSLRFNLSLPGIMKWVEQGLIKKTSENKTILEIKGQLGIKASSPETPVGQLSGGNQQKAVMGKWLLLNPSILILDEPTRGVDIGAKAEMYGLIRDLAEKGKAILVVSSELPELLGLCDKIYVMQEGIIKGCVEAENATQEIIMNMATGVN